MWKKLRPPPNTRPSFGLDAQSLARMEAAEALLQHRHDIRVHAALRMARLAGIW